MTNPATWLRTISDDRSTLSAAPPFAISICNRLSDSRLEGLSLKSLRVLWVGAEPIFPQVLRSFAERFQKFQFNSSALKPCYGLAEATLGVTTTRWNESWTSRRCAWKPLRFSGLAVEPADPRVRAVEIVCLGAPAPGTSVEIRDDAGALVSEEMEGNIFVSGPGVIKGYLDGAHNPVCNGWLDTGDLGFLLDSKLYVTGRAKDIIKRGGATLHPQDIESVVSTVPGLRTAHCAAVSVINHDTGREEIVILAETRIKDASARRNLKQNIIEVAAAQAGAEIDRVILVEAGALPRTTSGKLQRSRCGELALTFEQLDDAIDVDG